MAQSSPMNGGDGTYSYTKNSTRQRDAAEVVMNAIKQAVMENLDVQKLLSGSSSNRFAIADLGCSVGPNTFYAMQTLIEAVENKHRQQSNGSSGNLEFQVMFNDQIGNDFNTLFASLPDPRNYLAAGVPGSFYTRLFPSSSIHIAYSSTALHWLSKVPERVQVKDSPAWNVGKIHYTGASDAVAKAYADQFEEDMEVFFGARAQEIAPDGMIMILMPGLPHKEVRYRACTMFPFIETILINMVKEGVLEQEQVDSFNIPIVFPCINDMRRSVDKNGCFEIVKMEMVNLMSSLDGKADFESFIMHIRAALEGTIDNHFGKEMSEKVFTTAIQRMDDFAHIAHSTENMFVGMLFVVLKRKLI